MKNKENDIEQMLLTNTSLDDLIKMKMEEEYKEELEKANKLPQTKIITNPAQLSKGLIFSKDAVFKVFNKNSRQETFINGVQAEALIGVQHSVREKMLNGLIGSFSTDDAYVKFEQICVTL